ncbi:protein bicaudal c homolog 1-a [Phtheirospermum japonicum]|uniref:Protein bicaudal c homolog 1-a n=1 Tax=Phtheirospermum japonicum TaxID=374723 RepID=A0A830BTZ1_9LAMI|nr:protein bicaudal c homolog 1-a [Phtheirospermum japonicum]
MIMNEEQNENSNEDEEEEEEEEEEDFREFEPEGSESPKQSPVNSVGLQFWDQRRMRSRTLVSESNGPLLQNENDVGSVGVREWLTGLGLGRYTALFEIHEVDDEVLPLLTLDDLKDMGVNAVGSRRKMYNAILKLRKGFS